MSYVAVYIEILTVTGVKNKEVFNYQLLKNILPQKANSIEKKLI